MDIFLNLFNADKLLIHVDAEDTIDNLKRKIAERTGLPCSEQVLRLQNGQTLAETKISCSVLSEIQRFNYRVLTLEYRHELHNTGFYLNAVTSTGRVVRIFPQGSSTIQDVKWQVSQALDIPEDNFFLRIVDKASYINKPLVQAQATLEMCNLSRGSVLYVQIHPYQKA